MWPSRRLIIFSRASELRPASGGSQGLPSGGITANSLDTNNRRVAPIMPHTAKDVLEPRVGADGVELGIDLNPKSEPSAPIIAGSLKPEQGVLCISHPGINRRDIVW